VPSQWRRVILGPWGTETSEPIDLKFAYPWSDPTIPNASYIADASGEWGRHMDKFVP